MTDLSKIPINALSVDTKQLVSTLLNPTKWLPTNDGLPRDWRGLAHLWGISGEHLPSVASHSDPTGHLLSNAQNKKPPQSVESFKTALSKIDRWDIVYDTETLIERDVQQYLERINRSEGAVNAIDAGKEKEILTMDDFYRVEQGMDNQLYDAFVLYADEDTKFVEEMIDVLEKKHRLKLCLKDRDLMGGIPFEHEAVMRLISERCNRLIVVVSPDFLKSSANSFFLNYAQAVGIGTGQRKIIPCLYKRCQLPPQLAYQFILDYNKNGLYDFWGRLHACVQVVAQEDCTKRSFSESPAPVEAKPDDFEKPECADTPTNGAIGGGSLNSLTKIGQAKSSPSTSEKFAKANKSRKGLHWPKRKKNKSAANGENAIEPTTNIVSASLSLPSLTDLPSLDEIETPPSKKSTKIKKNLVAYATRVQFLMHKQ